MKLLRGTSLEVRFLCVVLPSSIGMLFFATQLVRQGETGGNWPLVLALFIVMTTVGLAYLLFSSSIRQLSDINATLRRLDDDNDLSARVKITSGDITGTSAASINRVLDSLTMTLNQYAKSNSRILATTRSLCDNYKSSNQKLARQQGQMDQLASSISELVGMIHDVGESTRLAAEATEQARSQTQNGALVSTLAICAIEAVFDDLDNTDETIEILNDRSRDVGVVLEVINSVSEQTNLLALNAAIEAARAGEHGRGFAVVADEVRKLASKTQNSIGEIQEIIDQLQNGARTAVRRMGEARSKTNDGVQQVEDSAEALGAIAGEVATLVEMNGRIAEAANQQSDLADILNRAVDEIQSFAESNRSEAEMREKLAGELYVLVTDIENIGSGRVSGRTGESSDQHGFMRIVDESVSL